MTPSMKVPPKRKGNILVFSFISQEFQALNESPSEKEGKLSQSLLELTQIFPSMKVPPKRKGNQGKRQTGGGCFGPSMKVPPKRKGNCCGTHVNKLVIHPQ